MCFNTAKGVIFCPCFIAQIIAQQGIVPISIVFPLRGFRCGSSFCRVEGFCNLPAKRVIGVFRAVARCVGCGSTVAVCIISVAYRDGFCGRRVVCGLCKQVAQTIIKIRDPVTSAVIALGKFTCTVVFVKYFQFRYSFITRKFLVGNFPERVVLIVSYSACRVGFCQQPSKCVVGAGFYGTVTVGFG